MSKANMFKHYPWIVALLVLSILLVVPIHRADSAGAQLVGDCNGDLVVNSADIDTAKQAIFSNNGTIANVCDANEDGVLNAADLGCIAQLIDDPNAICQSPNLESPLATNLDKVIHWTSDTPFINAFKSSSGWIPKNAAYGDVLVEVDDLDLDSDGYIISLPDDSHPTLQHRYAFTALFSGFGPPYPAGRYIVEHDGSGKLSFSGAGVTVDWANSAVFSGHYELLVTPVNGIGITLVETDPSDHVRNIRVYAPGFDDSNVGDAIFHPDFLDSVEPYKTLRFMDWMRTNWKNGSPERSADIDPLTYEKSRMVDGSLPRRQPASTPLGWADRPLPTHARYSTEIGVPLETMVALANKLNADAWFNMPHQADDQYVSNFAASVRNLIGPAQRVYVEYSNEIWNTGFDQGDWIEQQGVAEFGGNDPIQARWNWYAKRTAEMCDLWQAAWGAEADRVICVVGAHANNGSYPWIVEQLVNCPLWTAGAPCLAHHIDAIAIAPYVGARLGFDQYESTVENWTLDQLFDQLTIGGVLTPTAPSELSIAIQNMENYKGEADKWGLPLLAYEGGQHLAGASFAVRDNAAITQLFTEANNDARMNDLYDDYLDAWRAAGGEMFAHFVNTGPYSEYGSWGAQEFLGDDIRPKYDALMDFIDNNPCTWADCVEPAGVISADLFLNPQLPMPGANTVPIVLNSRRHEISSVAFALTYDTNQMTFDPTDSDGDMIPDAIAFLVAGEFEVAVDTAQGLIQIAITDISTPLATLADGTLATVTVDVVGSGAGLTFTTPQVGGQPAAMPHSCGDDFGRTTPCSTSGVALIGVPTAVQLQSQTSVAPSTPFIFGLMTLLTTISFGLLLGWSRKNQ